MSWGLPGWVGNGSFFSQDNIEYQTAWLRCMREVHGVEVDFLGLANERPQQPTGEYVATLRRYLDTHGIVFTTRDLMMDEDAQDKIDDAGIRSTPVLEVNGELYAGEALAPEKIRAVLDL